MVVLFYPSVPLYQATEEEQCYRSFTTTTWRVDSTCTTAPRLLPQIPRLKSTSQESSISPLGNPLLGGVGNLLDRPCLQLQWMQQHMQQRRQTVVPVARAQCEPALIREENRAPIWNQRVLVFSDEHRLEGLQRGGDSLDRGIRCWVLGGLIRFLFFFFLLSPSAALLLPHKCWGLSQQSVAERQQ